MSRKYKSNSKISVSYSCEELYHRSIDQGAASGRLGEFAVEANWWGLNLSNIILIIIIIIIIIKGEYSAENEEENQAS